MLDFPGDTGDQKIIRTVKDDLGDWNLRRLVWVADRGFASATNRAYLTGGGGHYIHAEKLRRTNTLKPPPRWPAPAVTTVSPATCGSKRYGSTPAAAANEGARAERFVVCHNPDAADVTKRCANTSSTTWST